MNNQFENSVKNIVWALRRIVRLISLDSRHMVKQYSVTGSQGLIIHQLYSSLNPLSAAGLSRLLNVTPSNITGIIDRLEEKGYVRREKNPVDRRTSWIQLTEKGRELGRTLPDLTEQKLYEGLKDLTPTETFGIYSALDTIIQIIGAEKVPAEPLDPI